MKKVKKIGPHSSKYQKDYQNNPNTPSKTNINGHRATYTHRYRTHTYTYRSTYTTAMHTYVHTAQQYAILPRMQERGPALRPVGTAYAIQKWSPPSQPNSPTTPMVVHTVLNRFPEVSQFRNTIKKDVTVVTTGIVQILSAL